MNSRTLIHLVSSSIAGLAIAGCIPSIDSGLQQAGGNAPLVLDLDEAGTPLVLGTGLSTAVTATVRGPNKGSGERGGITASFVGDGSPVCVIMDPANTWEESNTGGNPQGPLDDADSDLFVGLAANYTGTPGTSIGEFTAEYVDPLGVAHAEDENVCKQADLNGLDGAHAGAGTPEFCTIQTIAGASYEVLAESISAAPATQLVKVAVVIAPATFCVGVGELTLNGDNN